MQSYFNYFTEVEEHFQQKRGTWMLLSTLDWALIDTWREAGIPLDVVYRGIDTTFEKWEKRRVKTRKINALAFCLQEVLTAFEEHKEARVGAGTANKQAERETLFSGEELRFFFETARASIATAANALRQPHAASDSPFPASGAQVAVENPPALADDLEKITVLLQSVEEEVLKAPESSEIDFEQLERRLTAIEEKLLAALKNSLAEKTLVYLQGESEAALAPYKRNMRAEMIATLQQQFVNKRLLELWSLPRLSLFHFK